MFRFAKLVGISLVVLSATTRIGLADIIDDAATGVRVAIPVDMVGAQPAKTDWGHNWGARKGSLSIDTLNFRNTRTLDDLYNTFKNKRGRKITFDQYNPGSSFVLKGVDDNGDTLVYIQAQVARGEVRGLSIAYDTTARRTLDPVVDKIVSSFQPFPIATVPPPPVTVATAGPVVTAPVRPPTQVPTVTIAPTVTTPAVLPTPVTPSPPVVSQPVKTVTLQPVPAVEAAKLRKCPTVEGAKMRVALVIGNGKYEFANELPNPTRDAIAVGKALQDLGFDVVQGIDLNRSAMMSKIKEFNRKLEDSDTQPLALVYYAGHGMQVEGQNFLVPVDAKLERASDLEYEVINLGFVLKQLAVQTSCANLVLLDACRDNPLLLQRFFRSLGPTRGSNPRGGLAPINEDMRETLIEFSAEANKLADDGIGANSPFAEAFLQNVHSAGLDFELMMRNVRRSVYDATKGHQLPTYYGAITKDIVLLPEPLPGQKIGGPH